MSKITLEDLNKIPIIQVAERLNIPVNSSRKIKCFKGHDNKTNSLSFDIKRNIFKCFGCDIKGNNISLVKEYLNCDAKTAIKWLKDSFYYHRTYTVKNYPDYSERIKIKKKEINYKYDKEVYCWIIKNTTLSKKGYDYLINQRGFKKETIRKFIIKDISNAYTMLNKAKEQWGLERLIKCGLWKYKNGKAKPTWWGHVILFPFMNLKNEIIYIQARLISEPSLNIKYINLSKIPLPVYNLNLINKLTENDKIIFCEGIPDAIMLNQSGQNAFGIIGANNFKKEFVKYFLNYEIYVIPDNDAGGEKFYNNICEHFEKVNIQVKRISFDKNYNDISDYLRR